MRKWKILLIIFSFCILLGVFLLHHLGFIYIFPVPKYQAKTEPINILAICEKIKDDKFREVCFTVAKDKDFEHGLVLTAETRDDIARTQGHLIEGEGYLNYLEYFPWYYYDGIYFYSRPFIKGVEKLITEGTNHNPTIWCREFSTFPDGTQVNEDYYLCRAFLENPHFCKRIYSDLSEVPKDRMKRLCYEDAALVWQDCSLCEKALDPDFCYLRVILNFLKEKE